MHMVLQNLLCKVCNQRHIAVNVNMSKFKSNRQIENKHVTLAPAFSFASFAGNSYVRNGTYFVAVHAKIIHHIYISKA